MRRIRRVGIEGTGDLLRDFAFIVPRKSQVKVEIVERPESAPRLHRIDIHHGKYLYFALLFEVGLMARHDTIQKVGQERIDIQPIHLVAVHAADDGKGAVRGFTSCPGFFAQRNGAAKRGCEG